MANSPQPKTWRDALLIHPAAELFPLMSEPELRELGEDIKKNGLRSPIVVYKDNLLLDGRNRLDAMELVGVKVRFEPDEGGAFKFFYLHDDAHDYDGDDDSVFDSDAGVIETFHGDPYAFVLSANIHRRHLTAEQKRDLIAKLVKAKPEQSDRQVAKQTKTSPTTVGKVRKEAEATGDVSKVDTRTDTKGRKQPSAKPKKAPIPASPAKTGIALDQLLKGRS